MGKLPGFHRKLMSFQKHQPTGGKSSVSLAFDILRPLDCLVDSPLAVSSRTAINKPHARERGRGMGQTDVSTFSS